MQCGEAEDASPSGGGGAAVAEVEWGRGGGCFSDYAIQVISLLHSGCLEAVREERMWQIYHLQEIKKTK